MLFRSHLIAPLKPVACRNNSLVHPDAFFSVAYHQAFPVMNTLRAFVRKPPGEEGLSVEGSVVL